MPKQSIFDTEASRLAGAQAVVESGLCSGTRHLKYEKVYQRGNALLEFGLVAPLLMLFVLAVVDCGLYTYAFIAVQNAARVAALRNSSGLDSAADQSGACAIAIEELRGLPNTGSASACNGSPVTVTAALLCGTSPCSTTTSSPDGQPAAMITVTYAMPPVFQLPLVGPVVLSRSAQMKIRSIQ
jgi:Flp pilus assembly protein TadG